MTLEDLGYRTEFEDYRQEQQLDSFGVGRVVLVHRDRYTVLTDSSEMDCELVGNLRYTITESSELPAVGDWVAISEFDAGKGLIHAVLPRNSVLERKSVGKDGQAQVIAANMDVGIIVQSVKRDFSINRLERYLTICHTSEIQPIIVLSKIDLVEIQELKDLLEQVESRVKDVPVFALSNQSGTGLDELRSFLQKGKTYCLLGSSGVGKSTLINSLAGERLMDTDEISERIDRGKHVTTHRELIVLDQGILIDNPGMREIGITDSQEGLGTTFNRILSLSADCRYKDCTHINETDCAVLKALDLGELDHDSYENFIKMEKERAHFESSAHDRKKKGKDLGKMIKDMKKTHKKY